ncbi:MAG TPA: FKBP-type peptidyl-prolyl cis-trans isomerase [Candidatus Polarisedimenticolaceae bacterium]|nr:FKBP-type peptidyl-prolyl cis-trans isomerase [Candidatus Polarisedimenticolaceae bacterium]
MRRLILSSAIGALLFAFAGAGAADPATEDQKLLYALGMALAAKVPAFDPTTEEIAMIQAGITDHLQGNEHKVDMAVYAAKLDAFMQGKMAAVADREKTAGAKFRDEMAAKDGATKTDSGMIYFELQPGNGAQPTASDTVRIHYHGTRVDGTVFDSSVERKEPVEFAVNGVVPCFAEGLTKMKVGGKNKIVCPPELAYGDRGYGGIKPGSTLVFEVELLEVVQPQPAATPTP